MLWRHNKSQAVREIGWVFVFGGFCLREWVNLKRYSQCAIFHLAKSTPAQINSHLSGTIYF